MIVFNLVYEMMIIGYSEICHSLEWVIPNPCFKTYKMVFKPLRLGCATNRDVEFDIGNQVHQARRVALPSADTDVSLKGLPRATAASFLYKFSPVCCILFWEC